MLCYHSNFGNSLSYRLWKLYLDFLVIFIMTFTVAAHSNYTCLSIKCLKCPPVPLFEYLECPVLKCLSAVSAKLPDSWMPKYSKWPICPMPKRLSALSARVPECLKWLSALRVPKSPGTIWVLKGLSALRESWECSKIFRLELTLTLNRKTFLWNGF